MQNEQLQQARAKAETFLAQYTGLYEFAPIGYMTLDREGTIRDVNLTGVRLLASSAPAGKASLRSIRCRERPARLQRLFAESLRERGQRMLRSDTAA